MTIVDNSVERYRELLLNSNKRHNLVSRRNVDKLVPRLIDESLIALAWKSCRIESPLLDIGTGSGIPGIPIKLFRRDLEVVLLDSNRQKTLFLRTAVQQLGLTGVEVVWQRAEEFSLDPANHSRFGVITARGLGDLDGLLEWGVRLLKPAGEVIVWLSELPARLPAAASDYHEPEALPGGEGLVIVRFEKFQSDAR
jgi:16S rRNA (guanine527-N7)-methyltransferase